MTDQERAQERVRLVREAIEFTRDCANQDRKVSNEKHMDGHYVKALQELEACRLRAESQLKRAETLAK